MKTVTLMSSALISMLSTAEAKTDVASLATLLEDAVVNRVHLQQFDEDEFSDDYGEEATEEDAAEEPDTDEAAEEVDENAYDPLQPGGKLWDGLNLTHGIITGLYGPYAQRVRNYDCFSETYTLGTEMLNWYLAWTGFDKEDGLTLTLAIFNGIGQGWGAFRWGNVCYDEYMYGRHNPYRGYFTDMTLFGYVTNDFADVDTGFDIKFDIVYIAGILGNVMGAYNTVKYDGAVNYQFGHHLATGTSRLFMLLDKIADLGIFTPKKPWALYAK